MKIFALYLVALLFSFQASALEKDGLSKVNYAQQALTVDSPDKNIENIHKTAWVQPSSTIENEEQITAEKWDEFFLGVCIYTLIILVYSLYWHKNNKTIE